MNIKSVTIVLAACTLLQACGGGSHYSSNMQGGMGSSSSAPTSTLDPSQVLAATQATSDSDEPVAVNDGQVTLTASTDESSDPLPVAP